MNKENILVLLTGNSACGKTTLGRTLKERDWGEVLSFTTRKPRNDGELDEYVFLTREQFEEKKELGHFLETVEYQGNYYGLSKFIQDGKHFAIVNDVGRDEVEENSHMFPHSLYKFFIEAPYKVRSKRMQMRGDSPVNIGKRLKGDNFKPGRNDNILNGELESHLLADIIEATINEYN